MGKVKEMDFYFSVPPGEQTFKLLSDGGKQRVAAFMHLHFIYSMIDVSPGLVVHLWFPHNRS